MKTAWFIVVKSAGAWWVDFEGTAHGPFRDLDMAKIEAISLARAFDARDRQAVVYAPDEEGTHRAIFRGASGMLKTG